MTIKVNALKRHKAQARWYVFYDGKQRYLGTKDTTEQEAEELRKQFINELAIANQPAETNDTTATLSDVINFYLSNAVLPKKTKNTTDRERYCKQLSEVFGTLKPSQLKPYLLEKWLADHSEWNETTKCNVCKHLSAVFNWLTTNDKISKNPLKGVKRPTPLVRGEEYVITKEEYDRLLPICDFTYTEIVELLWHTGARPNEILSAKKEEVKLDQKVIRKRDHKTKKLGRTRDIPLNGRAMEIITTRCLNTRGGLLFKSKLGNQIQTDVLMQYMSARFKEANIAHPVCDYSFRHSAAVRWIEANIPLHVVAAWLGNTVAVCNKHYTHTLERVRNSVHLMPE